MTSSVRVFDLSGEIPPRAWQEDVVFFLSLWVWLMGINSSLYPDEPLSCGLWMVGVWEARRAGSQGVLRPAGAWGGVVWQVGRCGTVIVRLERGGRSLVAGAGRLWSGRDVGGGCQAEIRRQCEGKAGCPRKGRGLSVGEDPGAETGLALLKVVPLLVQLGGRESCTHNGWCSLE